MTKGTDGQYVDPAVTGLAPAKTCYNPGHETEAGPQSPDTAGAPKKRTRGADCGPEVRNRGDRREAPQESEAEGAQSNGLEFTGYSYPGPTEEHSEALNEFANIVHGLNKRLNDGVTFKGLSPTKLYAEGRANLIADLQVLRVGQSHNCLVMFERSELHFAEIQIQPGFVPQSTTNDCIADYWNDEPVFVCVVKVVQIAKPFVASRATVWRNDLNSANDLWSGSSYMSLLNGAFKGIRVPRKRELYLSSHGIGVGVNEKRDEQIKGGAGIVCSIADDERNLVRKLLGDFCNPLFPLSLTLDKDAIWLNIEKLRDFHIEIRDMYLGPFNL